MPTHPLSLTRVQNAEQPFCSYFFLLPENLNIGQSFWYAISSIQEWNIKRRLRQPPCWCFFLPCHTFPKASLGFQMLFIRTILILKWNVHKLWVQLSNSIERFISCAQELLDILLYHLANYITNPHHCLKTIQIFFKWEMANYGIVTRLINNMELHIQSTIMFLLTVKEIWDYLHKTSP